MNPVHKLIRGYKKLRGVSVRVFVTFRCNLRCPYCTVLAGRKLNCDEISAKDWIRIIETFPIRINKVSLIGGEPFIYPDIVELANGLMDRGYLVTILTNLTRKHNFKNSYKLHLYATYHKSKVYHADFYSGYNITHSELGSSQLGYKVKGWCDPEADCNVFDFAPDGVLHTSFQRMLDYYDENKLR